MNSPTHSEYECDSSDSSRDNVRIFLYRDAYQRVDNVERHLEERLVTLQANVRELQSEFRSHKQHLGERMDRLTDVVEKCADILKNM